MHSSFGHMLHCTALEDDLRRKALRAIEVLAYYFRDACYDPDTGWEPRFKVSADMAAIYLGTGESSITHVRDLPLHEVDDFYDEVYKDKPDDYDDYMHITYDSRTGAAEWVPGCGPAPIWSHPDAALTMTRQEMADRLDAWIKERW